MQSDLVNEHLGRSIRHHQLFKSTEDFSEVVSNDYAFFRKLQNVHTKESDLLHRKYNEKSLYKYQILCYLLRRYFNEIENNIRYPTSLNGYTINNSLNNKINRNSLVKLSEMTKAILPIVDSFLSDLSK